MMFMKQVKTQLEKMTVEEKEQWIMERAKLLDESEQKDFLMSLRGEKKITYMPSQEEIEEFCTRVNQGEIHLEYETHYYEFDDDGRYMDDWKVWYNDPMKAFPFVNRVLMGCDQLLLLGDYGMVADILDRICMLEFKVVESPDSDDFEDDSPFPLANASRKGLLSMDNNEIGANWVMAHVKMINSKDIVKLAEKLIKIFQHPICKGINPDMLVALDLPSDLFSHMMDMLNIQIQSAEEYYEQQFSQVTFSREMFSCKNDIKRKKELVLNLRLKCADLPAKSPTIKATSVLAASWKQIRELLEVLGYERYIDDQWQIEEIYNICNALIKRDRFKEETWELRKEILADAITHDYYDAYGCYDPISDLTKKLCFHADEFLEFADILDESSYYKREAALLYHKYGREDKYVLYLETHLEKESENYVSLIKCYQERSNYEGARQVAEQALEKCKNDLTDVFIYLLQDAEKLADKDRYKKLYTSAKRRRLADITRIDKALCGM